MVHTNITDEIQDLPRRTTGFLYQDADRPFDLVDAIAMAICAFTTFSQLLCACFIVRGLAQIDGHKVSWYDVQNEQMQRRMY